MQPREPISGMVFLRADGTQFKLGPEALGALTQARQRRAHDSERGGVLLGRHLRDEQHVIVDEVTLPKRFDLATRTTFRRAQAPHQRVIDERWEGSAGTCVYLGEWHTHPESTPRPSSIDVDDWRRRLRTDTYDASGLFFIIVGTRDLCVWEGRKDSFQFAPLPLIGTLL